MIVNSATKHYMWCQLNKLQVINYKYMQYVLFTLQQRDARRTTASYAQYRRQYSDAVDHHL